MFVLLVLIKKSPRPSLFVSPIPLTKYPVASASLGPGILRMLGSAASCRFTIALTGRDAESVWVGIADRVGVLRNVGVSLNVGVGV